MLAYFLIHQILPPLIHELRNSILVPFVLPNIFAIAELLDKSVFVSKIFPAMLPLFTLKEPFQAILLLLQKLDFFLQRLPAAVINERA
jgi:SCY1-like protein 2